METCAEKDCRKQRSIYCPEHATAYTRKHSFEDGVLQGQRKAYDKVYGLIDMNAPETSLDAVLIWVKKELGLV